MKKLILFNRLVWLCFILLWLLLAQKEYPQFDTKKIIGNGFTSLYKSVIDQDNNVHVVFTSESTNEVNEIFYRKSSNNGLSWGNTKLLTHSNGIAQTPNICVAGNTIHVVWADNRDNNFEIYYKYSTNRGDSWSDDRRLTNEAGESLGPTIIPTTTELHIFWNNKNNDKLQIYYMKGDFSGENWSEGIRLFSTLEETYSPNVMSVNRKMYLTFVGFDRTNHNVYFIKSIDDGNEWQPVVKISNLNNASPWYANVDMPKIAAEDNNISIAWMDNETSGYLGMRTLNYRHSTNEGDTWLEEQDNYNTELGLSYSFNIAILNKNNLTYIVSEFDNKLYCLAISQNGHYIPPELIVVGYAFDKPSLSYNGNYLHLVWTEDFYYSPKVYYSRKNILPDLDIYNNAANIVNNTLNLNLPRHEAEWEWDNVCIASFQLINTNNIDNPDQDGPSQIISLDRLKILPKRDIDLYTKDFIMQKKSCISYKLKKIIENILINETEDYEYEVIKVYNISGYFLPVLILVPNELRRGKIEFGNVILCVGNQQKKGIYETKIKIKAFAKNGNNEVEDSFRIKINIR